MPVKFAEAEATREAVVSALFGLAGSTLQWPTSTPTSTPPTSLLGHTPGEMGKKTHPLKAAGCIRKAPLAAQAVAPVSRERYRFCVCDLLAAWRRANVDPREPWEVDEAICTYVENLWSAGLPYWRAACAVAGLPHYIPHLRGSLPGARGLLKVWTKLNPPSRATPFTPLILAGLAWCAYEAGWPDLGALLLVGFEGLLRPGELFSLRRRDVRFVGGKAVLSLRNTKTGQRHGRMEVVILAHGLAARALYVLCRELPPTALLLQRSPEQARGCLRRLLGALQLGGRGYTCYSLRGGGATALFIQTNSMEATLLAGRWSSTRTARMYIAQTTAETTEHDMPQEAKDLLMWAQDALRGMLRG